MIARVLISVALAGAPPSLAGRSPKSTRAPKAPPCLVSGHDVPPAERGLWRKLEKKFSVLINPSFKHIPAGLPETEFPIRRIHAVLKGPAAHLVLLAYGEACALGCTRDDGGAYRTEMFSQAFSYDVKSGQFQAIDTPLNGNPSTRLWRAKIGEVRCGKEAKVLYGSCTDCDGNVESRLLARYADGTWTLETIAVKKKTGRGKRRATSSVSGK